MAKARIFIKRRKAVANIRKITKTMEMIATAKFRKVFNRVNSSRLYTEKFSQLVAGLASLEEISHPLLRTSEQPRRLAMLVLTSNRGLCGGYNGNVLRTALNEYQRHTGLGRQIELSVSGKKGIGFLRFMKVPMVKMYRDFDEHVRYKDIEPLANDYIDRFQSGQLDAVQVVYMRFISSAVHKPGSITLLPIQRQQLLAAQAERPHPAARISLRDYIFSPSPREILAELLPMAVRVRLFQCFIEAAVSEQVARMVAMKSATENAEKMIKSLTQHYNRARQTQITAELLEIMGGAEALK